MNRQIASANFLRATMLLLFVMALLPRIGVAQNPDDGYDPNVNGTVRATNTRTNTDTHFFNKYETTNTDETTNTHTHFFQRTNKYGHQCFPASHSTPPQPFRQLPQQIRTPNKYGHPFFQQTPTNTDTHFFHLLIPEQTRTPIFSFF